MMLSSCNKDEFNPTTHSCIEFKIQNALQKDSSVFNGADNGSNEVVFFISLPEHHEIGHRFEGKFVESEEFDEGKFEASYIGLACAGTHIVCNEEPESRKENYTATIIVDVINNTTTITFLQRVIQLNEAYICLVGG